MKKIISLIILSISSITFYGQIGPYSQVVEPAPYVPPMDLGLILKGEQYKREQQLRYEQQQREQDQQHQQYLIKVYNSNIELLNNIIASGYKCNSTISDGWHKILCFIPTYNTSGAWQVQVKDNKIIDFYINETYNQNRYSIDFSTSIVNCNATIIVRDTESDNTTNNNIYFVLE